MASLWLNLVVMMCITLEIIAVPLKIAPQEEEIFVLGEKKESELLEQRRENMRIRRSASSALPAGCEKGNVYGLARVPHCHVTNAKYFPEMRLCLVELLHVPGMPSGTKGYNYVAHNHFLYKAYNATKRLDIVRCPPPVATTPSPTKTTTTDNVPVVTNAILSNVNKISTTTDNVPVATNATLFNVTKISTTNTTITPPVSSKNPTNTSQPRSSGTSIAAVTKLSTSKPSGQ